MKQTKHILLTAVMLLCSLAASAHDFEVDGIYYNICSSSDLTVEVTYRGSSPYDYSDRYEGRIVIPSTVTYDNNTYIVNIIGSSAFRDCSKLTEVILPEGVTWIGNQTFRGCWCLSSINIPESVTSIDHSAFYDCFSLTKITLPEGMTSIEAHTFCNSALQSITIPKNVTSIGESAFLGCDLESIVVDKDNVKYDSRNGCNAIIETDNNILIQGGSTTIIPESVTSIANNAFCGCGSLTTIYIPESVTKIGDRAFSGCNNLTSTTISKGVTEIGNEAFYDCTGELIVNSIISKVYYFDNGAFYGSKFTKVTFGEGVTWIGERAFYGCTSITSITIPESMTEIGNEAFYGCNSLTSVNIPENSQLTSIGSSAFDETPWCNNIADGVVYFGKILYKYKGEIPENTSIEVKEGTIRILSSAFSDCNGLSSITIPESVVSIGNRAFSDCSCLTAINIPENSQLTSIEEWAFSDCSSLTDIDIPESVTRIGWSVFEGCSSLTSITIPESVTSIGESAFKNCSNLTIINIPERVTSIGGSAFEGCSRLTSITIPENSQLTRIERYAFYGCSSLIDINIPEGVTSIGELAFSGCSSLEYVTLNCSNVSNWFSRNTAIKEVVLGDGVATVENKAFQGCSGLTSIIIGKNVTEIGEISPNSSCAVFDNCTSLKEVFFEDGSEALAVGCNNYSANVRPNSRGEGLFYDCPLEKVYLGRNLSYDTRHRQAGASPFYAKGTLSSLTIGSEVTEVGENAFSDCGLDSITCYAMVPPTCASDAFSGVDTSIPVYVPEASVADYQAAEVWKDFLSFVGVGTGINNSTLDPRPSIVYDLHGRRIINTEGLKGIYIVDGKKVVIK